MRRPALLAAALSGLLAAVSPAAAQTGPAPVAAAPDPAVVPVYGFEVVNAWPHDPLAFTQGLIWHDGFLFESTGRSPSTIRRVRLDDGAVLRRRVLAPELFSEGLTELDGRLLSLTWQEGKGFIWDPADLSPLGEFAYEGEGWGLTTDGDRLILSDGGPRLRFLDGRTLAETGEIPVTLKGRPIGRLNELEWVEGEVFANLWQTDFILRIDPATGQVTGVIDLTGLLPDRAGMDPADDVLNGVAWDPVERRLFVTGKHWPTLFEIRLTVTDREAS